MNSINFKLGLSEFRLGQIPPFGLLTSALLLVGCASNTTVSSTWHDKSPENRGFQKVIVVADAEDTDKRLSFEDAVVYDLRSENTKAMASSRLLRAGEKADENNLRRLIDENAADAVVVTVVSSMDVKAVEQGGRTDVMEFQQDTGKGMVPTRREGTAFLWDWEENVEPVYVTTEYTTVLTTDVYSAATGESVYTVVTSAKKQETLAEVIDVLSDVIAERLRADGVIR